MQDRVKMMQILSIGLRYVLALSKHTQGVAHWHTKASRRSCKRFQNLIKCTHAPRLTYERGSGRMSRACRLWAADSSSWPAVAITCSILSVNHHCCSELSSKSFFFATSQYLTSTQNFNLLQSFQARLFIILTMA